MKIARIKGLRLGGWIVALYDLVAKNYVGFEIFVLPGNKEAIARQLAAALKQLERSGATGILQDMLNLCKQYGVTVNPQLKVYTLHKQDNPSR